MQLKNTTEAPIKFLVRTNAGATVTIKDGNGNDITKPEAPKVTLIVIPALATVELEDDLYECMVSAKTKVQEYDIVLAPVQGIGTKEKPVMRKTYEPTGKYKTTSLLKERISVGDLVVVEKPKLKVSLKEMAEALKALKINVSPSTHSDEEVQDLYERLCI